MRAAPYAAPSTVGAPSADPPSRPGTPVTWFRSPWLRRVILLALALPVGAVAVAALQAYLSARSGAALVEAGGRALRRGESSAALANFTAGRRSFDDGRAALDRWWLRPVGRAPVLGRQVDAARALLGAGRRLADAGARLSGTEGLRAVRLPHGGINTTALASLEGPLGDTLAELRSVGADLSRARRPLLLPPIDHRLRDLGRRVHTTIGQTETAVVGTRVLPGLFGAAGPRRYFLAIQTPAELRAGGGIVGSFGQLTWERGRLRLDRVGRSQDLNLGGTPATRQLSAPPDYAARYGRFTPEHVWQNVTMSPDFPTVAAVISDLYPESGGEPVDGVMGVDPEALAALLKLTGPVSVPGWPEPLSWRNAADILLRQQYTRLGHEDRVDFLEATARAVFDRLSTTSIPGPGSLLSALAAVTRSRHLMLYSAHPEEQSFFERIGASGALPPVRGDFMAALVQDASGTKLDAFLHRSVRYEAAYDPGTGRVEATAVVYLENRAPASGLPPIVIGGAGQGPVGAGENRLYLSVYSPLAFVGGTVDERPLLVESERELGRNVYSTFLTVPPGQAVTARFRLHGTLPGTGAYRLDVTRQATVLPDEMSVDVRALRGRVTGARGLRVDGRAASATLPSTGRSGTLPAANVTFQLDVRH